MTSSSSSSSSSSKGIDYSKWDNIQDSSDDDEEEEDERQSSVMPRVTRLDTPSRVTTTPNGTLQIHSSTVPSQQTLKQQERPLMKKNKEEEEEEDQSSLRAQSVVSSTTTTTTTTTTITAPLHQNQQQQSTIPSSWTKNGGYIESHNLYWSQDRHEVSLRIPLPTGVVVKELSIDWSGTILPYDQRYSATVISSSSSSSFAPARFQTASFVVRWNHQILFQGDLPYPIHFCHDDNDQDYVDWDIEYDLSNNNPKTKYVHMTLHKAFPMAGMTIHWTKPLQQVNEHPLQSSNVSSLSSSSSSPTKKSQLQQAWDEAHVMFRQKVANDKEKRTNHNKNQPPSMS